MDNKYKMEQILLNAFHASVLRGLNMTASELKREIAKQARALSSNQEFLTLMQREPELRRRLTESMRTLAPISVQRILQLEAPQRKQQQGGGTQKTLASIAALIAAVIGWLGASANNAIYTGPTGKIIYKVDVLAIAALPLLTLIGLLYVFGSQNKSTEAIIKEANQITVSAVSRQPAAAIIKEANQITVSAVSRQPAAAIFSDVQQDQPSVSQSRTVVRRKTTESVSATPSVRVRKTPKERAIDEALQALQAARARNPQAVSQLTHKNISVTRESISKTFTAKSLVGVRDKLDKIN